MCVSACNKNSEPTMRFSQTTPDEYPPTPPPCRWQLLITLRTLTKFQLVWHHLCDFVLARSSCLFERTLTAVCALQSIGLVVNQIYTRRFGDHVNVLHIFDQTCIVLKSGWSSTSTTARMPASSLVFPCLRLTRRRHQADEVGSVHLIPRLRARAEPTKSAKQAT